MKSLFTSLILLALPLAAGCAIGPPPRAVEPSVTAECCHYLQANWLDSINGAHSGGRKARSQCHQCSHTEVYEQPAPELHETAPDCQPACEPPCLCPLASHPDFMPYEDPGPPGWFLPVPVRPVFAPVPPQAMFPSAPSL
ncbi:MAG: hypothetical protein KDA37_05055 [Planctomycetales bacterium]|nr:hypothetical protein [Planctomycetales bacterium]